MNIIFDYNTISNDCFQEIADNLINYSVIEVNGFQYRIIEVEFYLKSINHNDEYTHCDPDQLKSHSFYFHKHKTGTYKNGTFKGMDITLGDAATKTYFGILIRSIKTLMDDENKKIIEGPCNVVNRILSDYDSTSITEFVNGSPMNIFDNEQKFTIKNFNHDVKSLYNAPRIGLSMKYPLYQDRKYRYVLDWKYIKKQRKSIMKNLIYN